jgi:hypothetical protein
MTGSSNSAAIRVLFNIWTFLACAEDKAKPPFAVLNDGFAE